MPKLTLRDLFAVVTIVALALGWWLDHQRLWSYKNQAESLRQQAERRGYRIVVADDGASVLLDYPP
jgi:hypothetical protein